MIESSRCSPSKWPKWLVNGGDPNYLLTRMILQVVEACFVLKERKFMMTPMYFLWLRSSWMAPSSNCFKIVFSYLNRLLIYDNL